MKKDDKYLKKVNPKEALDTMEEAKQRREATWQTRGWSKKRHFKQIAVIPLFVFQLHPEFWSDDKALKKWIKDHPEFKVSG